MNKTYVMDLKADIVVPWLVRMLCILEVPGLAQRMPILAEV
jgi:hypothetical protein